MNSKKSISNEDDEDNAFGFDVNEQIAYLSQIGKGIDDDTASINGGTERNSSNSLSVSNSKSIHSPSPIALWRNQLTVGSKLDCLDEACLWWTSSIISCDGPKIKVRYDGFDKRWDEWIDRGSTRIAPYLTKAKGGKETKGVSVDLRVVAKMKDKRTGRERRVFKQGFLVKQGKHFKSYKTRYFMLFDDGTMQYSKKMTDTSPIAAFSIKNMIETRRIEYPNKKNLFGFEIVTKERTWRFQAHSDEIVSEWIGVIHAVSKGVEPNDDDTQHAIIYSGFPSIQFSESQIQKSQSQRRHTVQPKHMHKRSSSNLSPLSQSKTQQSNLTQSQSPFLNADSSSIASRGRRGMSVMQLQRRSIQEERSSLPPINRAAFDNTGNSTTDEIESDREALGPNQEQNAKVASDKVVAHADDDSNGNDDNNHNEADEAEEEEEEEVTDVVCDRGNNIQHTGWMYKGGKWDRNWTKRFCVLTENPVILRCYESEVKTLTHTIEFKRVRSCLELKKGSDKFVELEIPTAFAFQLITPSRIFTFACESKHDLNVWIKKIRGVVDVSSSASPAKLTKRSSIVSIGNAFHKLGTNMGRLLNITSEHVTTTSVLKTQEVQIKKGLSSPSTLNVNVNGSDCDNEKGDGDGNESKALKLEFDDERMQKLKSGNCNRRASLPILSVNVLTQTQQQSQKENRRKSASEVDIKTECEKIEAIRQELWQSQNKGVAVGNNEEMNTVLQTMNNSMDTVGSPRNSRESMEELSDID